MASLSNLYRFILHPLFSFAKKCLSSITDRTYRNRLTSKSRKYSCIREHIVDWTMCKDIKSGNRSCCWSLVLYRPTRNRISFCLKNRFSSSGSFFCHQTLTFPICYLIFQNIFKDCLHFTINQIYTFRLRIVTATFRVTLSRHIILWFRNGVCSLSKFGFIIIFFQLAWNFW